MARHTPSAGCPAQVGGRGLRRRLGGRYKCSACQPSPPCISALLLRGRILYIPTHPSARRTHIPHIPRRGRGDRRQLQGGSLPGGCFCLPSDDGCGIHPEHDSLSGGCAVLCCGGGCTVVADVRGDPGTGFQSFCADGGSLHGTEYTQVVGLLNVPYLPWWVCRGEGLRLAGCGWRAALL